MSRMKLYSHRELKRAGRCRGCGSILSKGEKIIEIPPEVNRPVTFICEPCIVDMAGYLGEPTA